MRLSIYIVSFCIFGWSQADKGWDSLLEASDWQGLKNAEQQIYQEQSWAQACVFEKERSYFPQNCLELLQLQFQQPNMGSLEVEYVQINKLCLSQIVSLEKLEDVQKILKLKIIPSPCRSALLKREKDLKYSMGLNIVSEASKVGPDIEF